MFYDWSNNWFNKAKYSAECTHNHPVGIAGAQATALCIFYARQGKSKDEIRAIIHNRFGYNLSYSIEYLQNVYSWEGMPKEEWALSKIPKEFVSVIQSFNKINCK